MENLVLRLCEEMLRNNPNLTPSEMAHNLHLAGYDMDVSAKSVHVFYAEQTANQLCSILLEEYRRPMASKEQMRAALIGADFSSGDADAALSTLYPKDTKRYAVSLDKSFAVAPIQSNYNFGTESFTVEAWIKAKSAGVILARKGSDGGPGNGGFLLVLKSDGQLKFATDDGIGFYEVNAKPVCAFDDKWHHVLAVRGDTSLSIYWDFEKLEVTPRTNRYFELNVNNHLRMLLGQTDQWQEPYNDFRGCIGETRIWKTAHTYADLAAWNATDWVEQGLIALWDFREKSWRDISSTGNNLSASGTVIFVEWN